MDNMDQLFKANKDTFDRLEPGEDTWLKIKNAVGEQPSLRRDSVWVKSWWKIAASVVFILGVGFLWSYLNNDISSEFNGIALESPEGQVIPLDPSQNKYTLVQFWASGNAICTEENCYYYLPAYEKYKDHGFEIYAISLDQSITEWVSGIEENDLPWIHVSDLKGWESPICIECNITKVPSNFLLNQKGKVIARDLEAHELDRTLDKLLAQN